MTTYVNEQLMVIILTQESNTGSLVDVSFELHHISITNPVPEPSNNNIPNYPHILLSMYLLMHFTLVLFHDIDCFLILTIICNQENLLCLAM